MKISKINHTINSKGIKMNNKITPTLADEIKTVAVKLFNRAEREIPQNMTFTPVKETIKDVENRFQVGEFVLKIIADPVDVKNSRRVMLSAFVPNTDYAASVTVTKGSKSEILKEMAEDEFANKIAELLEQVADATKHFEIK